MVMDSSQVGVNRLVLMLYQKITHKERQNLQ